MLKSFRSVRIQMPVDVDGALDEPDSRHRAHEGQEERLNAKCRLKNAN
jgi:hypothetical protein